MNLQSVKLFLELQSDKTLSLIKTLSLCQLQLTTENSKWLINFHVCHSAAVLSARKFNQLHPICVLQAPLKYLHIKCFLTAK